LSFKILHGIKFIFLEDNVTIKLFLKNSDNYKKMNFIEVCAGAGGMSTGFEKAGMNAKLLVEIDKVCCETLSANHRKATIIQEDITTLDLGNPIFDVLIGGVPCQSFSQAGKRGGLGDSRGNLILTFIDIVFKLLPKVFVIENVVGLTTHNGGETLKFILEKLNAGKKYKVYNKILNANDYGVAQKRKRLFIVGVRADINREYEFPVPHNYKPVLRDVLQDVPNSEGVVYNEEKRKIMDLVPPGGCWVDLPEDIQKLYMKKSFLSGGGKRGIARRLSMDEASLTLTTSPCQKQTERCHPIETRPLNVAEYARIQSFPDDYIFCGTKLQKYKQIGNAVPVLLAKAVAESVMKVLE
jgi:DNA (cytosine-5)-methyltransferase 1